MKRVASGEPTPLATLLRKAAAAVNNPGAAPQLATRGRLLRVSLCDTLRTARGLCSRLTRPGIPAPDSALRLLVVKDVGGNRRRAPEERGSVVEDRLIRGTLSVA